MCLDNRQNILFELLNLNSTEKSKVPHFSPICSLSPTGDFYSLFSDSWTAEQYFGDFRQNFAAYDAADLTNIARHIAHR